MAEGIQDAGQVSRVRWQERPACHAEDLGLSCRQHWNDWGVDLTLGKLTLDKSQQWGCNRAVRLETIVRGPGPAPMCWSSLLWPTDHATCSRHFYLVTLLTLFIWLFVVNIFQPSQAFFIQTSTCSLLFWENWGHRTQISSFLPKKSHFYFSSFFSLIRKCCLVPSTPNLKESADHL